MRLTYEQALEVARCDYGDLGAGISSAIEKLAEFGFDTSYYWDTMEPYINKDDVDEDDMNTKTRDELYRRLGIDGIMDKAYAEVNP